MLFRAAASTARALRPHADYGVLWIGLGRSLSRLREVLSAKERASPGAIDGAGSEDDLSRAIDELCQTRIEAADMRSRCAVPKTLLVCCGIIALAEDYV